MTTGAEKRPASDMFDTSQSLVKRQRSDANLTGGNDAVAVVNSSAQNGTLVQPIPRTSGLQSPIMELMGHSGEVFATRFDPTGHHIASGSADRSIMLWNTYGSCENYGILAGHKGAIMDLQWSRDSRVIFSASADQILASWDLETGTRIRRYMGHEAIVNSVDVSRRGVETLTSASDDGYIGIWDPRQRSAVDFIETDYPVVAIASPEANGGNSNELYSGGIDNDIHVWDLRKRAIAYSMVGHTDTITSLALSPDSQFLLSHSMDSTLHTWDVRPFAPVDRLVRVFDSTSLTSSAKGTGTGIGTDAGIGNGSGTGTGIGIGGTVTGMGTNTGIENNIIRASWDPTGQSIAVGTGIGTNSHGHHHHHHHVDRSVLIWHVRTGTLAYHLPGHKGAVNDVRFHPGSEPIVVSASSDRTLIVGELGK